MSRKLYVSSLSLLPFSDKMVDTIVIIPSLEELPNVLGKSVSSYDYRAEIGRELVLQTFVLQNPVHGRYWEVLLILSKQALPETPQISVLTDQKLLVSKILMQQIQDIMFTNFIFPPKKIKISFVE